MYKQSSDLILRVVDGTVIDLHEFLCGKSLAVRSWD
jgi:hypothetical protein